MVKLNIILFLLVVAASCAFRSISALDAEQEAQLALDLASFQQFLNASITNAELKLQSTSTSCSIDNIACNPYVDVPTINFSDYIPREYGYVQPKPWVGQSYTDKMQQTCALISMGPQWLANYNNSNNTLLYQYFTYPDNYAGFYPASPWNCSQLYTPTERPYYVAGATGQKDMVILIDASSRAGNSAWRLATAKSVAAQILKSLSFRDFVSVVTYGDRANQQITLNTQATAANIAALLDFLDTKVVLMPNNGTNIGAAFDYAFRIFDNSAVFGLTSKCTQTIVLLSGGDNDNQNPPPGGPLSQRPDVIVFPFLISNNVTTARTNLMTGLACGSKSITRTISSAAEVPKWGAIIDYFSMLTSTSIMRWSEVYSEEDGQSDILSLSAAVFTENRTIGGVATLDVKLGAFTQGDTISISQINDYNLANLECSPLQHRSEANQIFIDDLQDGLCSSTTAEQDTKSLGFRGLGEGEQLEINRLMPLVIVLSILLILGLFGGGICCISKHSTNNSGLAIIALIVFLVCWIIAIPIMFSLVSPDLVKVYNYVPVDVTIVAIDTIPFRCCEITSCDTCSQTSAPSCSSEISRMTLSSTASSGTCGNGYKCCSSYCYSCNCRRTCRRSKKKSSCSTRCSTCCRCTDSISNNRCTIGCGTCYSLSTTIRYTYRDQRLESQWSGSCSLGGAESCKNNWIAKYSPVGSSRKGFVNPENPSNVEESVAIRDPPFIAFMVFACLSIPFLIAAYYLNWLDYSESTRTRSAMETQDAKAQPMLVVPTDSRQSSPKHSPASPKPKKSPAAPPRGKSPVRRHEAEDVSSPPPAIGYPIFEFDAAPASPPQKNTYPGVEFEITHNNNNNGVAAPVNPLFPGGGAGAGYPMAGNYNNNNSSPTKFSSGYEY